MNLRRLRVATTLLAAFPWAAPGRAAHAADPPEFKIVFIAYENPDQLVEDVRPVVAYLERRLGLRVKHFVASDYAAIVEAMRGGSADAGFMGPLQYVMARRQAGAVPLLGELYRGKATYVSRIFVRKDSGLKRLEDLRGRSVAFVDPLSSSGFMYPLDIFRRAGLIPGPPEAFFKKVYFAGGDEQAIRAVFNGFVDAAGIGQYALGLLRPEERDEVTHIAESRLIPSHCVVVRKGLDPGLVERFKQALLDLNAPDHPDRDLLQRLYGVEGYVPVTPETYEEVEALAREYGFLP